MSHLLIEEAKCQPEASPTSLQPGLLEAAYHQEAGLWLSVKDGSPWVHHPEFSGPKTKKFDIESGEDEKGR